LLRQSYSRHNLGLRSADGERGDEAVTLFLTLLSHLVSKVGLAGEPLHSRYRAVMKELARALTLPPHPPCSFVAEGPLRRRLSNGYPTAIQRLSNGSLTAL
jgi:hypothetical protein